MIFLLISILVPPLVYFLLPLLLRCYHAKLDNNYKPLLLIGCFLFFISWYLPSPLIDGQNTAFTTHFLGGGIFCGFVWLYIIKSIGWKSPNIIVEAASLYILVSALGVLNELAELFFVRSGLAHISLTDTSWDLLANTLGALIFFVVYKSITSFSDFKKLLN